MMATNANLSVSLHSEHRITVVMALVFLPWIVSVFFTAGGWAALNFLGYAILVFAAGYSIVRMALPASARTQTMVFAPAVGTLAISALTAFWLRLGLPLIWVPALWLGLVAAGALCLWSDRALWPKSTVAWRDACSSFSVDLRGVLPSRGSQRRRPEARRQLQLDLRGYAMPLRDRCGYQERRKPAKSTGSGDRGTSLPLWTLCTGCGHFPRYRT